MRTLAIVGMLALFEKKSISNLIILYLVFYLESVLCFSKNIYETFRCIYTLINSTLINTPGNSLVEVS